MRIETINAGVYPGNHREEDLALQERVKRSADQADIRPGQDAHIRKLSLEHVRESAAFLGDTLTCTRAPQSRPYDAGTDPRRDGESHVRPLSWQQVRESLDFLWATLTRRKRTDG